MAWKWGQVMNKAANKKCIAQLGHKLWSLKQLIFNKDWCDLYALHIIKYAYIETTAIKSLNKSLWRQLSINLTIEAKEWLLHKW